MMKKLRESFKQHLFQRKLIPANAYIYMIIFYSYIFIDINFITISKLTYYFL